LDSREQEIREGSRGRRRTVGREEFERKGKGMTFWIFWLFDAFPPAAPEFL
jgi:hypothetical protein